MVRYFTHRGTTFSWEVEKAESNIRKHDVTFEEATTAFDDPLFIIVDASRREQERQAVIGFSVIGRLLTVVHAEADGEHIKIISARRASLAEEILYAE